MTGGGEAVALRVLSACESPQSDQKQGHGRELRELRAWPCLGSWKGFLEEETYMSAGSHRLGICQAVKGGEAGAGRRAVVLRPGPREAGPGGLSPKETLRALCF